MAQMTLTDVPDHGQHGNDLHFVARETFLKSYCNLCCNKGFHCHHGDDITL